MDETVKRRDLSASPANTQGRRAQQESPEEKLSSGATPIAVDIRRNACESEENERMLRAQRLNRLAAELMSGMTEGANVAANQPGPTEEEFKTLQSKHVGFMIDEITSDSLVRLVLEKHLSHIDRLEEWEKQSKKPRNDWAREMQVLISLVAIRQKIEAVPKHIDARVQTRPSIPEPQLSEEAQKIAKLSKLDQQLLREAGEKTIVLLKRRIEERSQSV
jgi:hypothetical protein